MFLGTYPAAIDDKGRLTLPEKWRAELAQGLVLTRGLDQCVLLLPLSRFASIVERLEEVGLENNDARVWTRFLSGEATDLEIDREGRVPLSTPLREFASLGNDVSLVGVLSRIEIWDPLKYDRVRKDETPDVAQMAERLHPILKPIPKKTNGNGHNGH